jgi:hypothetical protein
VAQLFSLGCTIPIMPRHAPKTDKRLLGSWKSDRRRTVSEWRFKKRLSPQRKRKFLAIFGRLALTYTRTRIRGVLRRYRFIQSYKLLAADSDTVAIIYHDSQLTSEWRIQHIHFQGTDRFWIALGPNREWFKRVKKRAA